MSDSDRMTYEGQIHVEFRLVGTLDAIFHGNTPCVPAVGELVNLDGDPYRVVERKWAIGALVWYAYLDITPAGRTFS